MATHLDIANCDIKIMREIIFSKTGTLILSYTDYLKQKM